MNFSVLTTRSFRESTCTVQRTLITDSSQTKSKNEKGAGGQAGGRQAAADMVERKDEVGQRQRQELEGGGEEGEGTGGW